MLLFGYHSNVDFDQPYVKFRNNQSVNIQANINTLRYHSDVDFDQTYVKFRNNQSVNIQANIQHPSVPLGCDIIVSIRYIEFCNF